MKTLVTLSMLVGSITAGNVPAIAFQQSNSVDVIFDAPPRVTVGVTVEGDSPISLRNTTRVSTDPPSVRQSHTLDLCVEAVDGDCSDF